MIWNWLSGEKFEIFQIWPARDEASQVATWQVSGKEAVCVALLLKEGTRKVKRGGDHIQRAWHTVVKAGLLTDGGGDR